jgi:hypothetical protein
MRDTRASVRITFFTRQLTLYPRSDSTINYDILHLYLNVEQAPGLYIGGFTQQYRRKIRTNTVYAIYLEGWTALHAWDLLHEERRYWLLWTRSPSLKWKGADVSYINPSVMYYIQCSALFESVDKVP